MLMSRKAYSLIILRETQIHLKSRVADSSG